MARDNIGLGTIATQDSNSVSITGGSINGITDLAVADGGTGASTLTGVLTGNGTSAITANAVTQYGTVIAGASNSVSSVAPSATSGIPYISQGAASNPTFGTAVVAGGGTGATTFGDGYVLIGKGTGAITALNVTAKGSILVGDGTTDPIALSVGTDAFVLTANSGTASGLEWAAASGGGITWNEITGTSENMAVNNGYIANNAGLVTLTLPTTAAVGSVVEVVGYGAGGWLIAQNASEIIHFQSSDTTTGVGGSLASTVRYDSVALVCTVANNEWVVKSSMGNITIV